MCLCLCLSVSVYTLYYILFLFWVFRYSVKPLYSLIVWYAQTHSYRYVSKYWSILIICLFCYVFVLLFFVCSVCVHTGHQAQWGLATATTTTTNEADDDDKSFCTNSVAIVFLFLFSFLPLFSCKLIRLFSHSSLHCSFSSFMFVTFLGISCASLSLYLSNSLSYFTLMSFTSKKRAFMFSHFFPFIFCFSIVPFSFTTATTTMLSARRNSAKRERETCLLNSALSLSCSLL